VQLINFPIANLKKFPNFSKQRSLIYEKFPQFLKKVPQFLKKFPNILKKYPNILKNFANFFEKVPNYGYSVSKLAYKKPCTIHWSTHIEYNISHMWQNYPYRAHHITYMGKVPI